jgi:hypothetical protein
LCADIDVVLIHEGGAEMTQWDTSLLRGAVVALRAKRLHPPIFKFDDGRRGPSLACREDIAPCWHDVVE